LQLPVSTLNLFHCSFSLICYLSQCRSLDLLYFHYNCYFWHFFYIFVKPLSCSLSMICCTVFETAAPLICYFYRLLSMICFICQCCSLDLLFCFLFFLLCFETKFEGCDPDSFTHFNLRFNQQVKCTVDFLVSTSYL